MQVIFNPDLDDSDEALDESVLENGTVDDDTLRLSYHLIRERWIREDSTTAASVRPLQQPWKEPPNLSIESFTPILVGSTSGIRQDVSPDTLKLWSDLIKGAEASNTNSNAHEVAGVSQNIYYHDNNDDDDCDSNADDEYAVLEPALTFPESTIGPHVAGLAARTCGPESFPFAHQ